MRMGSRMGHFLSFQNIHFPHKIFLKSLCAINWPMFEKLLEEKAKSLKAA